MYSLNKIKIHTCKKKTHRKRTAQTPGTDTNQEDVLQGRYGGSSLISRHILVDYRNILTSFKSAWVKQVKTTARQRFVQGRHTDWGWGLSSDGDRYIISYAEKDKLQTVSLKVWVHSPFSDTDPILEHNWNKWSGRALAGVDRATGLKRPCIFLVPHPKNVLLNSF